MLNIQNFFILMIETFQDLYIQIGRISARWLHLVTDSPYFRFCIHLSKKLSQNIFDYKTTFLILMTYFKKEFRQTSSIAVLVTYDK